MERCSIGIRDGGVLVYATCSLLPEENEMVIEAFLDNNSMFSLLPIENPFTGETSSNGLTIAPPETNGNGMFIAKLRKTHTPA